MGKLYSIKYILKRFFIIITLLLLFISLFYTANLIGSSIRSKITENVHSLEKYAQSLALDFSAQANFNRTIISSDPNLSLLSISDYPDSKRLVSLYHLRQIINYHDLPYCITMLYDSDTDEAYYSSGIFWPGSQKPQQFYSFMHQLGIKVSQFSDYECNHWFYDHFSDNNYLIIQNRKNRANLCTLFCIENYIKQYPVPSVCPEAALAVFTDDSIVTRQDYLLSQQISLADLKGSVGNMHGTYKSGHFLCSSYLEDYGIGISVIIPFSTFMPLILEQSIPNLIILIILTAIFIILYKLASRFLLIPVTEISNISKLIEKSRGISITEPSRIIEISEIQQALTALIKNISELENDRQSEKEEKLHALLQYYQLQTKSHFFINCLKSLYGMLENGQTDKMKRMIIAFSNHLRYVFHDNLSLVPLELELQEVEDYYQILSLDSHKIFILNSDVDNSLKRFLVPPLIIQSFLENSYKYSEGRNGVLLFNIRIIKIIDEETAYLQIHLSDNGTGYPEDILDAINQPVNGIFDQSNVGINNLKRRMSILYENNSYMIFFNLPVGGACSIISVPLIPDRGND